MNFFIKKVLTLLIFTLVTFCSIKKVDNVHGIINLDNKAKSLNEGSINKNDVIKNLGPPPLKEFNNSDIWIYFEVRDTRSIYGNKQITANNTLILEFDNKGILSKKVFLNKDQMQQIQFEDNETISRGIDNSLLKNILSSTRKRMENLRNKNK